MTSWSICHFCKGAFESDAEMKEWTVFRQGAVVKTKVCLKCDRTADYGDIKRKPKRKRK